MRTLYHVITIRGMPVRLHYTWLIAALLGIPLLAQVTIPTYLPDLGSLARIVLALLIFVLFFGAVVLHESAHLLVARLFHVHVGALNLYPLGALTRLPNRHGDPKAAFWIAAVGPVVSILLWWVLNSIASAGVVALWLAVTLYAVGELSLYLGLINLLPGLPLDGGRMLRAIVWLITGAFETATKAARVCGQLAAYGLILFGVGRVVGAQDWLMGGAMIVVGWAIREAGGTAYRRALVTQLLQRLTAADVMVEPLRAIGPERSLRDFALTLHGRTGNQLTAVIANGMFVGMIDRERLQEVPQGYWDIRTVAETMAPAAELDITAPDTPVSALIPRLVHPGQGQQLPLPVVREGRLLGLVDAEELPAILDLEEEFGLFARSIPAQTADKASAPALAMPRGAASPTSEASERAVGDDKESTEQRIGRLIVR